MDHLHRSGSVDHEAVDALAALRRQRPVPVLGITGTGGSGKSSLTDEMVRRFRLDQQDKLSVAILAVDPTRRRAGGALLGDRIRMNAIDSPSVFLPVAGHPRILIRAPRSPPPGRGGLQCGRIRPDHPRDAGHRPG